MVESEGGRGVEMERARAGETGERGGQMGKGERNGEREGARAGETGRI